MPGYGFIDDWGVELTRGKARQVRAWRAGQDLSWRGVAAAATAAWGSDYGDNQLFGQELCEAAARLLGEDPDAPPWN